MLLEIEESTEDIEDLDQPDYVLTSVGSDDPVHLYLKEIGNYPLLSTDDEVELSKRIEQGDEEAKNILANRTCVLLSVLPNAMSDEAFLS